MKKTIMAVFLLPAGLTFYSCEYEKLEEPVDCNTTGLTLALDGEVTNTPCGESQGSFAVMASGGNGDYQYTLNGNQTSSASFANLSAGVYEVAVADGKGCTATLQTSIQNLNGINISVESDDSGCGTNTGSITISASGGETPYAFALNGGTFTSQSEFVNLAAGKYEVLAVDNTGCETSQTVTLLTGVSYSATIAGIIQNNCAISGCHAGSQSPDLRSFANIQKRADRIMARTGAKTMPPDGALAASEIQAIACWVNDGALNN